MNFVGHVHIAALRLNSSDRGGLGDAIADPSGYLTGAALPDFAAMGRFRLMSRPSEGSVAVGIDFHHRTDDAFHRHPWFRGNSDAVTADLEQAGINRGAARACGHVGVELLLDGHLLAEGAELRLATQDVMRDLTNPDLGLATAVDVDRRDEWWSHLRRVARWELPDDYRDPVAVAKRLHRILARRPRLAFGTEEIPTVARLLEHRQSPLEGGAAELVRDLDKELAA